ncbi:MAG: hypothetical protein OEY17_01840 [Nitrosopumilus sp.]|nr:hypothetical protein [Nitrosopumilus sp.]MDH5658075.1 hypothetical protein [Nitrosopumilus sp.]
MNVKSIRKSKLFHREEMQKLQGKDYLKVAAIVGIIVVPLIVGLML